MSRRVQSADQIPKMVCPAMESWMRQLSMYPQPFQSLMASTLMLSLLRRMTWLSVLQWLRNTSLQVPKVSTIRNMGPFIFRQFQCRLSSSYRASTANFTVLRMRSVLRRAWSCWITFRFRAAIYSALLLIAILWLGGQVIIIAKNNESVQFQIFQQFVHVVYFVFVGAFLGCPRKFLIEFGLLVLHSGPHFFFAHSSLLSRKGLLGLQLSHLDYVLQPGRKPNPLQLQPIGQGSVCLSQRQASLTGLTDQSCLDVFLQVDLGSYPKDWLFFGAPNLHFEEAGEEQRDNKLFLDHILIKICELLRTRQKSILIDQLAEVVFGECLRHFRLYFFESDQQGFFALELLHFRYHRVASFLVVLLQFCQGFGPFDLGLLFALLPTIEGLLE